MKLFHNQNINQYLLIYDNYHDVIDICDLLPNIIDEI